MLRGLGYVSGLDIRVSFGFISVLSEKTPGNAKIFKFFDIFFH